MIPSCHLARDTAFEPLTCLLPCQASHSTCYTACAIFALQQLVVLSPSPSLPAFAVRSHLLRPDESTCADRIFTVTSIRYRRHVSHYARRSSSKANVAASLPIGLRKEASVFSGFVKLKKICVELWPSARGGLAANTYVTAQPPPLISVHDNYGG